MWLSEKSEALGERIETLGHPGPKETGQSHTGSTSLGAAGTAANFAGDDQRAPTSLGEVVVCRNS